jgi:hypothetical protein
MTFEISPRMGGMNWVKGYIVTTTVILSLSLVFTSSTCPLINVLHMHQLHYLHPIIAKYFKQRLTCTFFLQSYITHVLISFTPPFIMVLGQPMKKNKSNHIHTHTITTLLPNNNPFHPSTYDGYWTTSVQE